jgi:hypothetical protein
MIQDLDDFIQAANRGAAECVQWQATDVSDNGNGYPIADGGDEYTDAVEEITLATVTDFVNCAFEYSQLRWDELTDRYTGESGAELFGHDFVLSANGHGTGFWDRGLGDLGDQLHELTAGFGIDAEFALNQNGDVNWLMVCNAVVVDERDRDE